MKQQQEGLSHLISIIKDDLEDIKLVEHGLNETIHIRGGVFSWQFTNLCKGLWDVSSCYIGPSWRKKLTTWREKKENEPLLAFEEVTDKLFFIKSEMTSTSQLFKDSLWKIYIWKLFFTVKEKYIITKNMYHCTFWQQHCS